MISELIPLAEITLDANLNGHSPNDQRTAYYLVDKGHTMYRSGHDTAFATAQVGLDSSPGYIPRML